jgi:hypothetical protein
MVDTWGASGCVSTTDWLRTSMRSWNFEIVR